MGAVWALGKIARWSTVRATHALRRSSIWRMVALSALVSVWIASGGRL